MRELELLAPAKNLACGMAAISHGADAVYIGASKFGARAAAGNSLEDIAELCVYAHQYGAKVYVTVNTIIYDEELDKTFELLQELKNVKASDAREITRLKKELATVREVLRSYIRQVDSLNQVNMSLMAENDRVKDALAQSNQANEGLRQEKQNLTEKVAIAAQLDASGISMQLLNKRQKTAKKIKDCKTIQVNFTIARNVTAENGNRTLYVRIQTPAGQVLTAGSFPYENRQLEYSMKKVIEYAGEEVGVQTFWQVGEYLEAGQYRVSIFADGNMIGSKTFTFN